MGTPESYRRQPLGEFLSVLSAPAPAPGGGTAAAVTVALAAGLVAMAAGYSDDRASRVRDRAGRLQAHAVDLAEEDAAAYAEVLDARSSGDGERQQAAWQRAIAVPLEIAECGARTAADAVEVAERGRPALRGDALTAVVLAEAAVRAAVRLVELNVGCAAGGEASVARARTLADDAGADLRRVSG